jgi:hypothetical protein
MRTPGRSSTNAAFPHKEGLGFSIELKAFPSTVGWSYCRLTATTTGNSRSANLFGALGPLFLFC